MGQADKNFDKRRSYQDYEWRGSMKVEKIITKAEELEITGATLLSIEEAKNLPLRLRQYDDWWWLRSPGYFSFLAAYVHNDGSVDNYGYGVSDSIDAVRPALKIKNLKSSNFQIGDVFIFGDKKFEIMREDYAFCLKNIGYHCFREDRRAIDANQYEKSDVKKFVDKWFKKGCKNG